MRSENGGMGQRGVVGWDWWGVLVGRNSAALGHVFRRILNVVL